MTNIEDETAKRDVMVMVMVMVVVVVVVVVVAITLNDNRGMSVDVESVTPSHSGRPMDVGSGEHWLLELIIRTEPGTAALRLLSGDKDKLRIDSLEAAESALWPAPPLGSRQP